MPERRRSFEDCAQEICALDAAFARQPDRKDGDGKLKTRALRRLLARRASFLADVWGSRPRPEASYARAIKRLNAEVGRLPDRKNGKGKKHSRAWHRLVDRKTALLKAMWDSCPHPEAIEGTYHLSRDPRDALPLEICTICGWDESAIFREGRLASSKKIPLDDAAFLVEFGKIIKRLGING